MITREFLTDVCTHSKGTLACIYSETPDKLRLFVDAYLEWLFVKSGILTVALVVALIATFLITRKLRQVFIGSSMGGGAPVGFTIAVTAVTVILSLSLSLTTLGSLIRTIDDILIWSGPLETLVFQKL